MEDKDSLRLAFDAWKFQVETFWTRSSYFVVFELAIAAGLWRLFADRYLYTSVALSLGAILLTCIWFLNNIRLGEYINYYWHRLGELEEALVPDHNLHIFCVLEGKRKRKMFPGNYRHYIQIIPIIFFFGWIWLLMWALFLIACKHGIH